MSTLSPCHLLSTLVWDLREKLNTLVYRLETQALMVAASRTQHIGRSSDEVERATDEVTRLESKLMSAAAEAAAEHGFEKPCSFQELAEACDAEHDFCLSEHRQALVMLGEVVSELVVTNKEIARKVIQAQSVISSLEKEADTYSASGTLAPNNRPSIKLDRTV